ncbi:uncharacterized protein LOC115223330 [Octopus sinensis]|uniref:Uncharacterized protein LOC115223330 n=1 Tax=Octopus sinensis TaxID=2607531 RepID=A0A6P7THQ6_9MOLL|nr:uncharacterized protein LOC115223330 [Octopus sinensis]
MSKDMMTVQKDTGAMNSSLSAKTPEHDDQTGNNKDVDSTTDKSNYVDAEEPPDLETEPELELELSVSSPMSFTSVNPDFNEVSNQSSAVKTTRDNNSADDVSNSTTNTRTTRTTTTKANGKTPSKGEAISKRRGTRQLTRVREMDRELASWINGFYTNDKLDELTRDMITDRAREIAKEKKILDFAGTANWFTRFLGRNFSDASVSKQLKMLSFANPGKFMEDFDPERSAREMRKMNRRIYRENVKKNQMYDEAGRLLDNSKDVCDCLDEDCPGCHFPCRKCGSEKCGTECRCNRKWVYELVEIEGTNLVISNSSLP